MSPSAARYSPISPDSNGDLDFRLLNNNFFFTIKKIADVVPSQQDTWSNVVCEMNMYAAYVSQHHVCQNNY